MNEAKNIKCVCIPEERYNKMLESYDKAILKCEELEKELEALKEDLKKGVA
ncbi:MAG: hypothetical protein KBS60_00160 [Phascolarctobacterium sp.]|nr:hypothetical protein [Candidatus Phascolarctobacterium caballi]